MTNALECPPIVLDDSASQIENQQSSINSPSSMNSIDYYINLLSPGSQQVPPISAPKKTMISQTSRQVISTDVLHNPYISPSIKIKINEIIADSNTALSSYGRYQVYFNKASTKPNCLLKTAKKPIKHFYKQSLTNLSITKDSSAYKINQMKQKFQKTLESSSSYQPLTQTFHSNNKNSSNKPPKQSLKHSLRGPAGSLKKILFNENEKDEIDSFQKEFKPPQKLFTTNSSTKSNNFFMKQLMN